MAIIKRATVVPAPYSVAPSQQWDGNDGYWSTFDVNVGTPGQNFRVLPSTAGSETWVPLPDGCQTNAPSNCPQLRGVENFDSAASTGFMHNRSSTWKENGIYTLDLETRLDIHGNGFYGYDNVSLGATTDSSKLSLGNQVLAGIADTNYFLGLFGLGIRPISFSSNSQPTSSFMSTAFNQSKIPSLSYGYTAGAKYRAKGVFGSLTLGGYDANRFTPSTISFPFSQDDSRALTVGVQSITASNTIKGVVSFTAGTASNFYAVVDSSVSHLWLPRATCDLIADAFGLQYDDGVQMYWVNDTTHSTLLALNPLVTFKLSGSIYDTGNSNSTNIVIPYSAFDLKATWPFVPPNSTTTVNYFPIRRAANDTQYTLGRTFLQEAYLIVDHQRRNFSINQATFNDPTPAPQLITIQPPNSSSDKDSTGLGTGAIAGVAVGGAALLAIIIALVIFFMRKKKAKRLATELDGTDKPAGLNANGDDKPPGSSTGANELAGTEVQELYSPNNTYAKHAGALGPIGGARGNQNGQQGYHHVPAQELETNETRFELDAESNFRYLGPPRELDGSPVPSTPREDAHGRKVSRFREEYPDMR